MSLNWMMDLVGSRYWHEGMCVYGVEREREGEMLVDLFHPTLKHLSPHLSFH